MKANFFVLSWCERCIQVPRKRWRALQQQWTAESRKLMLQTSFSWMFPAVTTTWVVPFDHPLNRPFLRSIFTIRFQYPVLWILVHIFYSILIWPYSKSDTCSKFDLLRHIISEWIWVLPREACPMGFSAVQSNFFGVIFSFVISLIDTYVISRTICFSVWFYVNHCSLDKKWETEAKFSLILGVFSVACYRFTLSFFCMGNSRSSSYD